MAEVILEEVFDADNYRYLMSHDGISQAEKKLLRAYKKLARDGNKCLIQYVYGKKWETRRFGDLYAAKGVGLASFERNIRACLAQKYYWDIDLVNAHPSIIQNYCKELGLSCPVLDNFILNRKTIIQDICNEYKRERWWAKEECIKVFNGGASGVHPILLELMPEIGKIRDNVVLKYPDIKAIASTIHKDVKKADVTTLSLVFQDKTRQLLECISDFMKTKKRSLDVRIHDGGFVRKLEGEESFPEELLRECEVYVFNQMNYTIQLEVKPLEHTFNLHENEFSSQLVKNGNSIDNDKAALEFVKLLGDKIKKRNNEVFYFSDDTGMWENTDYAFRRAVIKHANKLRWHYFNGLGALCYINYGGDEHNVSAMKKWVANHVPNDDFFEDHIDTDIGKFLFSDGIFDMKTNTFTPGFNPNIIFTKRIDRPFPTERNEELIARINDILFESPFLVDNRTTGLYLKKTITMALFGDYKRKLVAVALGDSDCGKGLTTNALMNSFNGYVSSWDSSELFSKDKSGMDVARQNSWLLKISNSRLSISNEMRVEKKNSINVDIYKKASSGGDILTARYAYGNEINFVNKSTLLLMANDFNEFSSKDDSGVKTRSRFIRYDHVFKNNPTKRNEKKGDPSIKGKFDTDYDWKNSLFWIIVDCYNAMTDEEKTIGGILETPDAVIAETNEWIDSGETDVSKLVKAEYIITDCEDDFVVTSDIISYLQDKGLNQSVNKLGREITNCGFPSATVYVDGEAKKVRRFLKHKSVMNQ
jgi:hypothetical protein